jgi:hypothetical protein
LYDYSPDPSAFRADIYKEMSEFNSGLSTYFFIISAPLLANIAYVIINVYVQGLMVGFNVTSEMIFSTVYWLEEICCFALAVISGLVYKMLSLSWDEDLFDLNGNTFHKLTAVLFLLPLSALFPILAFAFMNVCAKIYLISYLIYFSVGFIFLLTKRIELSSPSSGATAFFLEKLRLFYNFSSLLCGTFSLYLSSSFYEAIKAFALSVSGEGFIFISPAMVYAGAFNFFDLVTGGDGELFIVYNAWCWLMSCTFVLLIIFILAFFTAFNYEYGFNDGVSPLSGFFFRLICLSTSIAIFFLGGLGSDNSTTTLACSGFFFALEPKYSINLSNAKLCGYGFLSKGFMALCVAAGASTALFPEKAGAAALGFAAATGAIVGQAFLNHSGKASVDMYTQGNIVVKKAAVLQFKFETRVGDVFKNVKSHAEAERLALKLKYCPEFRQVTIQFLKARLSQELTHNFENNNNDSVFGTGNFRSYYCFTTQARDSGLLGLCPIYNNWFINSHPVFKGLINEVNLKTDHVAATIAAEADPLVPSVEIIASLKNFDAALVQPAGAASMKNVGTEKSSEHATYKSIKPLKGNTVKPLKGNTVKPLKGNIVKPLKSNTVKPLKGNTVKPLKGNTVKPLKGNTVKPLKSNTVKPLKGNTVKPLKSNTVKPLKSNTVKPLKGKDLKGKVLKLDEFDLGS